MLPEGGLYEMYGAPAVGKSFIALDIAFSVGTGHAFHEHAVQRGYVVYVNAEGGGGLGLRVSAWKTARAWPGETLTRFLPESVFALSGT